MSRHPANPIRHVWIALIFLGIFTALFTGASHFSSAQQSQIRLFNSSNNQATEALSFRVSYRDGSLPANWQSPVDWKSGRIYWRVNVKSKPTNTKLRLRLCMRREQGTDPSFQNKCQWNEFILIDTVKSYYLDIGSLESWVFENNNGFDWDKPITEFYISVWDEDDRLFKTSNCAPCYSGPLTVRDHYPIVIDTEAYVVAPGATFSPPAGWDGGGQQTPAPTSPQSSPKPSFFPTSQPGECLNKHLGDANCDDAIGLTDYNFWRMEFRQEVNTTKADFNGDGRITLVDFQIWRRTFTS